MIVSMKYGADTVSAPLSQARCLGVLGAAQRPALADAGAALDAALNAPIGLRAPLSERFSPGDTVAIAVSDASRHTGVDEVLPRLVSWLSERGISEQRISFLVATGVHRPATSDEQAHILGKSLYARFRARVHNHNAHDAAALVAVGATSRGTVVTLNQRACDCDHLILTGAAMPHYFAGFGGGRKALVPGLAGADTIAQNHARSLHPTAPTLGPRVQICVLDGNPVAEDLLEAAQLRPPTFIVNTVLGSNGSIIGVFAGELNAAHRQACSLASEVYCVSVAEQADLVIAATSDAPNFIQCHKALFNAYNALKPNGRIILLAPASEGLGGDGFRRYLEMGDPETVAAALRKCPDINGQTALSTLEKAPQAILITELNEQDTALTGASKSPSLENALQQVQRYFRDSGVSEPTCYLMPQAAYTVVRYEP